MTVLLYLPMCISPLSCLILEVTISLNGTFMIFLLENGFYYIPKQYVVWLCLCLNERK